MKKCLKCLERKSLPNFYTSKVNSDGYSNACKHCTREGRKEKYVKDMSNPVFVLKERERKRNAYTPSFKPKTTAHKYNNRRLKDKNYRNKFPEKGKAHDAVYKASLKSTKGVLHHWSYLKEHRLSVIDLTVKEHKLLHRFIVYDQERMQYRNVETLILLDSLQSHLDLLTTL